MTEPHFELPNATLTDVLFESVRTRIINGLIGPGERVTEARLVNEYGVARPTAKGCIERLVHIGLLRRSAHKAAFVPELSDGDVVDLFLSRFTVERAVVEHLARSSHVPEAALQAQRDVVRAAEDGEFPEQVAADLRFHSALVEATDSPRLKRMHELILGEVALTMGLHSAHSTRPARLVAAEHQAVMDAIESGSAEGAAQAMAEHLRGAEERVLARFASNAAQEPEHQHPSL